MRAEIWVGNSMHRTSYIFNIRTTMPTETSSDGIF
nr:MAG TPA: hypothetical protein [Caudoviricetes sp.]